MDYKDFLRTKNAEFAERHVAAVNKINEIFENPKVDEKYVDFFKKTAKLALDREELLKAVTDGSYFKLSMDDLNDWDELLRSDFSEDVYEQCYGNPAYSVNVFGDEGQILSVIYHQVAGLAKDSITGSVFSMTLTEELFVSIYDLYVEGKNSKENINDIFIDHKMQNRLLTACESVYETVDPSYDYFSNIIKDADLTDLRYLYFYGKHITDNEKETAEFINSLSEKEVRAMADTFTQGFLIGYEKMGKDIHKKSSVALYYTVGFERMMRFAMESFAKEGLACCVSGDRIATTSVNRQFDYDHKNDMALYLNEKTFETILKCTEAAFENSKDKALGFAGPAVLETFGEKDFNPENKEEAVSFGALNKQDLLIKLTSKSREIQTHYIIPEERSFTIISYPIPEIGEKFKEIFSETVKVNTLDYKKYETMQQKIIDVLDQADFVTVKGRGKNRTDLRIKICNLKNPEKETAFENCVADVNIPVGEVFTSPVLEGTNGLLHVTEVYLNGLKYKDLEVELKDGMIRRTTCRNFEKEEDNQKFLKDNLLFQHETLPVGEFAIGTNTVAYKMGIEYDCQAKLPILIAEKTGPHFAMGDTCFSRQEEMVTKNPDGKEMVAKENSCSLKRNTEEKDKAYFNCHTDITIPYNELDTIIAVRKDGSEIDIIRDGRFVVPGTEELNIPLDELNK